MKAVARLGDAIHVWTWCLDHGLPVSRSRSH